MQLSWIGSGRAIAVHDDNINITELLSVSAKSLSDMTLEPVPVYCPLRSFFGYSHTKTSIHWSHAVVSCNKDRPVAVRKSLVAALEDSVEIRGSQKSCRSWKAA